MQAVLDFVAAHGFPVVFAVVFLDQLGLPIPTAPVLLGFGAMAAEGRLDPALGFLAGLSGSVAADLAWYGLGRRWGRRAVAFLCRISLEPDSCVSQTEGLLVRRGVASLLVAKFVPGYDTVAPALAGLMRVDVLTFAAWTAAGGAIWLLAFCGLGWAFHGAIESVARHAESLGGALGVVLLLAFLSYLAWKWMQRRGILKSIRMTRIAPDELHALMLAGNGPAVVDVRGDGAVEILPVAIPGALSIAFEELESRIAEIPRDRDVVFYCT